MPKEQEVLRLGDREVVITNPGKVFFEAIGATKLDLVKFYLAVAPNSECSLAAPFIAAYLPRLAQ